MKLVLSTVLLIGLLVGAPLTASPPGNLLEADGCDVMVYVENLPTSEHTGSWLVQSVFSGETYTYTWDQVTVIQVVAPDGLSAREVLYVNWRLEELGAKGTNRTEVRIDLTQFPFPFDFDGEIIGGTRYPKGGIGGTGAFDPATGPSWTAVNLVFCQGHR